MVPPVAGVYGETLDVRGAITDATRFQHVCRCSSKCASVANVLGFELDSDLLHESGLAERLTRARRLTACRNGLGHMRAWQDDSIPLPLCQGAMADGAGDCCSDG